MTGLSKIINDYIQAIAFKHRVSFVYEHCSCGFGSYIGFFSSPYPELDVIQELNNLGFECQMTYDGVFFRHQFILEFT